MTHKELPRVSEAKLRAMVETQGMRIADVARAIGRSDQAVRQACSVLGIRRVNGAGKRAEVYFGEFAGGRSLAEVAKANGVSHQCVSQTLRRAGLPANYEALAKWLIAKSAEPISTPLPNPTAEPVEG